MSEIICHDLAKLEEPHLFSEEARLVNKGVPSKALTSIVLKAFALPSSSTIYSSSKAYLMPAGTCSKGDVACLRGHTGDQLQVCQVWMHVEVNHIAHSLVSMWELIEIDTSGFFAVAQKKDDAIFVLTSSLACTMPFCHFENNLYKLIVPLQMK